MFSESHGTGRPRRWAMFKIVNAIFYVLGACIAWRLLPSDLTTWQTVHGWFSRFRDSPLFEKINHALVVADRERVGRETSPTAAIIDGPSVETTESGGPRGTSPLASEIAGKLKQFETVGSIKGHRGLDKNLYMPKPLLRSIPSCMYYSDSGYVSSISNYTRP